MGTGLTYKKGKTVKVKHKTSGKSLVIIDKPNVRKEYEKIGFFAEGTCGYGLEGELGEQPAGPHLLKKKKDVDSKKLLYKKKKYYMETSKVKKVKNVSVQYMDAEYVGDMAFSGYFRKAWLYKKDNGEWFAVIVTKNKNRYEIQLGKHKDKLSADKAAEKLIKRNLTKLESVNEDVSPKGWNMSKKFITILGREIKNLQKYHRQQNEEDFLEVANYMELQLKYMKKNLNESVNETKLSDEELVKYALYIKKYKPGLWNQMKKNADMKQLIKKFKLEKKESVNEDEMNDIIKLLVKYGNKKSEAIKMTKKHYDYVSKKYKNAKPVKKAEIISSLSANESVNEDLYYGYYKNKEVKVNAKSDKDAKKQIISKLKIPKGDLNRASMINHTKNQFKLESVNENKTLDLIKLYNKALKMAPGSPAQKKILKKIGVLRINLGMNESVNEALRPSDKKALMVIGRDTINKLRKTSPDIDKPSKQLGQAINAIFRAMTREKSDANYKQYKKYFPKYNEKLLRRLAKAYFDQPFNVQNTFMRKVMDYALKESVNEGKANIYGVEYRKVGQSGAKFQKSSLTMVSHQGRKMHKKMTMAIIKKAEKLRKQDNWADYRITVNGAPYIGWGGKAITGYPQPKLNEAPGKNHKDQYVGQARVKVEPGTYKGQKVNFHDVSMYRDHKKPYHYYLSIKLAHSNKVDMVVDTGTHIQSKAGKWAQGFIKRRMSGTGNERFS